MADLHDFTYFLCGGWVNNEEGFLMLQTDMRGPVAAGMGFDIFGYSGDIGFAEDGDKVCPGGFEVCRCSVVL
jgi:hypothetical protein